MPATGISRRTWKCALSSASGDALPGAAKRGAGVQPVSPLAAQRRGLGGAITRPRRALARPG